MANKKVTAAKGGHGARASAFCQHDELIAAITEDRAVTSCPVL